MEKRKYTFKVGRKMGASRSYTKTEDKLTAKENALLLGDLIKHYNESPVIVQLKFINMISEELGKVELDNEPI